MKKTRLDRRGMLLGLSGAAAGSLLSSRAVAGDLNPPPGPPAPTMRTLQQIADRVARTDQGVSEPRIPVESLPGTQTCLYAITAPGSYMLTRNLQGLPAMNGIEILSPDVDLDLDGFHLFGAPGGAGTPGSRSAILCATQNVCVYNGTASGWTRGFDFGSASLFLLWDVVSIGALSEGFTGGHLGQMYDCDCSNCPGSGFSALGDHTLYEECGTWACAVGFACSGAQNLYLSNCATASSVAPFQIGPGNAYGPIVNVAGAGDISAIPNNDHPDSNLVY
jgi:hypothetical protein